MASDYLNITNEDNNHILIYNEDELTVISNSNITEETKIAKLSSLSKNRIQLDINLKEVGCFVNQAFTKEENISGRKISTTNITIPNKVILSEAKNYAINNNTMKRMCYNSSDLYSYCVGKEENLEGEFKMPESLYIIPEDDIQLENSVINYNIDSFANVYSREVIEFNTESKNVGISSVKFPSDCDNEITNCRIFCSGSLKREENTNYRSYNNLVEKCICIGNERLSHLNKSKIYSKCDGIFIKEANPNKGQGNGLKSLVVEGNLFSLLSLKMEFEEGKIESIKGLPPGLEFESTSSSIIGIPTQFGKYELTCVLDNKTKIGISFEFKELRRIR